MHHSIFADFTDYTDSNDDEESDKDLPEMEINPDFTLIDDMILSPDQYDILYNNVSRRDRYEQAIHFWPNAVVPYILDNTFSRSAMYKLKST